MMRQNKSMVPVKAVPLFGLLTVCLAGCVTSRVEDARENVTGLNAGDSVVIMAKSYHQGNATESKYITCIEDALGRGSQGLRVIPRQQFVDSLFPWFEPRTAPAETKGLTKLMERPGVSKIVNDLGVRYIVWLDGDTETVAQGGSLSCAAGPGGGGCFGFAWWQKDADYEAAVWDLEGYESAGTVTADVSGTSFLPALVVPIPLIARTQAAACKGLAQQLRAFIIQ
ncbi:MAG: hypothetical protein KJO95_02235 [Gammaproteobacteria bacterium]|nr:hypothetical protein [Gammaproteobacteria bacterium]NNC56338.1 hypothetical protein [Woeseiaceae bacterium]